MDIPLRPRPRRNAPAGHTQEIDTAAPRRAREEGPQELAQSKWRQSYAEQELLEQEVPEDDFGAPEDAPYVEKDLRSIRTGLTVRQVVTAVLAFLSLYLTVSLKVVPFAGKLGIPEGYMLPLPPAVAPENNMRLFLIVNLVLVVLAAIVCSNIVGGGIAALTACAPTATPRRARRARRAHPGHRADRAARTRCSATGTSASISRWPSWCCSSPSSARS
ncbi:MAG: hypothetical protein ACLVL7_10345 [Anaerotruncus massiliensis (ex Togo et al. 2019)]